MIDPEDRPDDSHSPGERSEPQADVARRAIRSDRFLTIPNALCMIRLIGSPVLVWLALAGTPNAFVWLFIFLAMTDWVDGKIAVWLNQRSSWGARLDSWADLALYLSLLVGSFILEGDALWQEAPWLGAAIFTYAITTLVGFLKFGRWPSYHTRMAKTCWFLTTVGALFILSNGNPVPLRVAMAAVCVTNVEAICISFVLNEWHADVPSIFHAWNLRRREHHPGGGDFD